MSSNSTTPEASTTDVDTSVGMSVGMRRAVASAAAVIGAGATMTGLATSASAHPAPAYYKVWNRVAACESGGNWKINTGNGFYGGVQFSSSTWASYGGHKYAKQASGASRREQIEVARRVLHSQGPNAWPVCGPHAGLTKKDGAATKAKLPASDEQIAAAAKHSKATHKSKPASKPKSKPAAKPKATKAVTHKAKHSAAAHKTYTVKAGDTLSSIAHKFHVHGGWHTLFAINRATVHNANVLKIGQRLLLPKAA